MAKRVEEAAGIENFARLHEGLYRGAHPTPEGFRYLKEHGFRTVVSLRAECSCKAEVEASGMDSVEIPLQVEGARATPPTPEQARKFLEVVTDPSRQPLFFHCAHGEDRAGTMAALYRIKVEGWTLDEAIQEMRVFCPHGIHPEFLQFLKDCSPARSD